MNRIQKVLRAARWVKRSCTITCSDMIDRKARFQVVITEGSYESLRRLARALDDLKNE